MQLRFPSLVLKENQHYRQGPAAVPAKHGDCHYGVGVELQNLQIFRAVHNISGYNTIHSW